MVRRAPHKVWFPNHWDLVGGHVEDGESVEAALIREVQEEVGLTPAQFRKVANLPEPSESGDPNTRYHLFLVTQWDGGEPTLLGEEHTAMQWIALAQVSEFQDIAHPDYLRVFHGLMSEMVDE
jgi:8-oxo-dGTP pyrophosphatase MutT (NUDIX family)